MADETIAASSTAVVEHPEPVEVEHLNDEQYRTWQKTGDLPVKAKPEAPPASKPVETPDDKGASEKKAESGTAKPKPRTDERFQELLKERKEAREEAEKLRKELAEIRAAKPKETTATSEEKTAASLPPSDEPKAPERPKRPKLAEFQKMEDYEAAMDKYDDEMLQYPSKKAAFDSAKTQFEKQKADITERQTKVQTSWKTIAEKGREIYGEKEWNSTAFNPELPIFQNDPIERYLRDSEPEIAAHMLQHLALNPDDLKRINGLSSRQQFKELEALETKLQEEMNSGEKPAATEPPKKEKEVTAAKKPPAEVGGQGANPPDEEEAALRHGKATGDYSRFNDIRNRKDIAARKAGRK